MKGVPNKLGADPKRLVILGLLTAALGAVLWMNRTPSAQGSTGSAPAGPAAVSPVTPNPLSARTVPQVPVPARRAAPSTGTRSVEDFRPSLKLKEGADVSRIDPTLKLDLLAKLRNLAVEEGSRSIFEFSQPPAPPLPKVAPIKPGPQVAAAPKPPPPDPAAKPPAPPPPPIPLKFYGYANTPRNGPKRAFFLDGEDIFVAGENDLIRNRYKIIRIGVNSAVVEDTTTKNQQTLPLIEELAG